MLTAYGCPNIIAEAEKLGVLAFLAKPFSTIALLDAVAKALGRG